MSDGIKHVELHNAPQGQHLSIDITSSSPVCDNSPKLKWVPSSNGQVPCGAVPGGHSETGETLYIARAIHDKTHTPGKLHPSHGCCYIAYAGAEFKKTCYEVMVFEDK